MAYDHLLIDTDTDAGYGVITLNRPDRLNALGDQMMSELTRALDTYESMKEIQCIILTGGPKYFSGGADVTEVSKLTFPDTFTDDLITRNWERASRVRKPLIAAVAGYAVGGGFELALMCDFIIAADNARFGQPEIRLGVMPGAGGTQRLARIIGKAKTMELCLTGRFMEADEAERCGVAARVVPAGDLMDTARETAKAIALMPQAAAMMVKEAVNTAFEMPLAQGILHERRLFQALFATQDQKEGMAAYLDKRTPHFRDR